MIKESFIIEGLGGKKSLKGSVTINGAKNAALKAMAAAILFDGPVTLANIPDTADVETMKEILVKLGAKVSWKESHVLEIDPNGMNSTDIDFDLAKDMRSSVVLSGPMLARFGKVSFPSPGGCVIGARPIDLFINGYKQMNAETVLDEKTFIYSIAVQGELQAAEITFEKISVGATETLMMAAVLGKGTTVLNNCAKEPEIVNVAEWLNAGGANIQGAGTSTITIMGTGGELLSSNAEYTAIPDRIEAGSFLILGVLCAEELIVDKCEPKHMGAVLDLLKKVGANIEVGGDRLIVKTSGSLKAFDVKTSEYPGFPTDLQSPLVTLLTQAEGEAKVTETIFEGRFKYTEDLVRMGADIKTLDSQNIMVAGPISLKGSQLHAHDIRAGFALVAAALVAGGSSTITNVHLIDRGYEKLEEKLGGLGADIKRVGQ